MAKTSRKLTPKQQQVFDGISAIKDFTNILVCSGEKGSGKTTVLRALHEQTGGAFLAMGDILPSMLISHPLNLEDQFADLIINALNEHNTVYVDDLHLVMNAVGICNHFYPRSGYIEIPFTHVAAFTRSNNKRLFIGTDSELPKAIRSYCFRYKIDEFDASDYQLICQSHLDDTGAAIDYNKIHRFARNLNGHQLTSACIWLTKMQDITTDSMIEYLREKRLASNVHLAEVQQVLLSDLIGIDDVLHALEVNVLTPFENDALTLELGIKPKRGILLAGHPGTGKTTIGRALAHRMKGKFFLIDGTFISGTKNFYNDIQQIFEAAKENAPSIIFIDDSDVIFESGDESGLYRYLLTMLDGLESESVEQICVIMTAMNVANLPPALVRSGRIELWLETRLPDTISRTAIIRKLLKGQPSGIDTVDANHIAEVTEGFTGADLKRLVEDGKLLFAYDKANNLPIKDITSYFISAVETVRANKERYAQAEATAKKQFKSRPPWFNFNFGNGDDDDE